MTAKILFGEVDTEVAAVIAEEMLRLARLAMKKPPSELEAIGRQIANLFPSSTEVGTIPSSPLSIAEIHRDI